MEMEDSVKEYPSETHTNLGHNFRRKWIIETRQYLEHEFQSRTDLYKKYKKATNTLSAIDVTLLAVGLGSTAAERVNLLSSVIGAPAAIIRMKWIHD